MRSSRSPREIKERLEALAAVIPGIARAHVGIDLGETAGNWDVVLDSDFASREDLQAYQVHPAHADRLCVDRVGALRAGIRGLRALTRFGKSPCAGSASGHRLTAIARPPNERSTPE